MHRAIPGLGQHASRPWNQLVAAQLNIILAKRKLLLQSPDANFLWSHIQPASKDGVVRWNPTGKYVMRAWHQGEWKMVIIDDTVPCDEKGLSVLPQCSNPMELWPLLLSKLILKLWPGYEFDEAGSNSGGTEVLYSLCGWISQSGVESKSLLAYPYSKANRPSSPLLPFNPLTDSVPSADQIPPSITSPTRGATPSESASPTPSKSRRASASKPRSAVSGRGKSISEQIEVDEQPVGPPPIMTTEQLHAHASRRGELGWYNELVYAAPGSLPEAPSAQPGANPAGLLFAFAWSSNGTGISGYPSLGALLELDATTTPLPILNAAPYEFDVAQTPLMLALNPPPITSPVPSTPASGGARKSVSATVAGVQQQDKSAAGKDSPKVGPKSIGGKEAAGKEKEIATAPVTVAAPLSPLAEALLALVSLPSTSSSTDAPSPAPVTSSSTQRVHCLLLESLRPPEIERREIESLLAARDALLAAQQTKGGKGGAVGKPGVPGTPSAGAKKPSAPGDRTSAASPAPGGKKGSKKEEEERLRLAAEEDSRLLAEQARQERAAEEFVLKTQRAQARMEAWLRGEEAMLAEEEQAKTTPQLKVTDLTTAEQVVVRVDSFAESFDRVELVRQPDRYSSLLKSLDFWCSPRDLRRPYSSCASAPSLFIRDVPPEKVPHFESTKRPPEVDLALAVAQGVPAAAALALQAHHEKEASSAQVVESAALSRRLYVQIEFQSNILMNGGAADAEPCTLLPNCCPPPGSKLPPGPLGVSTDSSSGPTVQIPPTPANSKVTPTPSSAARAAAAKEPPTSATKGGKGIQSPPGKKGFASQYDHVCGVHGRPWPIDLATTTSTRVDGGAGAI